ncbi:MAG: NUDIX domain-containing protein [Patescibacteria group bacterium]|nr:NUDIX domain-containing protein [Patescibacteria group bacterium]
MQTETRSSTKPSNYSPRRNKRVQDVRHGSRHRVGSDSALEAINNEISAGGIIFRRRNGSIEIFFIKDPFSRWTFPKGHQEEGETLVETAVREIREETGLTGLRYVATLGRTSFRFRRAEGVIQKVVHIFLFEAPPNAKEHLTGEGAIFEGRWVKAQNVFSISGYKNLDRLLARALRAIAQTTQMRG